MGIIQFSLFLTNHWELPSFCGRRSRSWNCNTYKKNVFYSDFLPFLSKQWFLLRWSIANSIWCNSMTGSTTMVEEDRGIWPCRGNRWEIWAENLGNLFTGHWVRLLAKLGKDLDFWRDGKRDGETCSAWSQRVKRWEGGSVRRDP